jgi:hypothetical protein
MLRLWVQIPPGPHFPVVQLRYYFELILGDCRTDSAATSEIISEIVSEKKKRRMENYCCDILFLYYFAYGSTSPKSKVRMSTPPCCMCSTTFSYVREFILTFQLGLGHISSAPGRGGGPMVGDAVTCPLRG